MYQSKAEILFGFVNPPTPFSNRIRLEIFDNQLEDRFFDEDDTHVNTALLVRKATIDDRVKFASTVPPSSLAYDTLDFERHRVEDEAAFKATARVLLFTPRHQKPFPNEVMMHILDYCVTPYTRTSNALIREVLDEKPKPTL